MFYLILNNFFERETVLKKLAEIGIQATSHYEALHGSEYYKRLTNLKITLPVTERISRQIIRLPLHTQMNEGNARFVAKSLLKIIESISLNSKIS
jgi:dTDP-4-amino-4,6-dideoxygalactose transaminase